MATTTVPDGELVDEQQTVDELHRLLDDEVSAAMVRLEAAQQGPAGTHQARSERDAAVATWRRRHHELAKSMDRLYFGRLDRTDGTAVRVGRVGLTGRDGEVAMVDWRAPAAKPFYRATPSDPLGVARRRHLITTQRRVRRVEDDVVDPVACQQLGLVAVQGDGALLSAINAPRTGRMGDVVATIQRDQDQIIRAPLSGTLVVDGGPGTGKTVVALHRLAYLLYTYRHRLDAGGVLVVGPNDRFLSYISHVLPELGERAVVLTTAATLLPGVRPTRIDAPSLDRLKGDLRMTALIEGAVRAHQRVPRRDTVLRLGSWRCTLTRRLAMAARRAARRSDLPHNEARAVFARHLARGLARQIEGRERTVTAESIQRSTPFRAVLDALWPALDAEALLAAVYRDETLRTVAARGVLGAHECAALQADDGAGLWSAADIALLDEARVRLGELPRASRAPSPAVDARLQFAADTVEITRTAGIVAPALLVDRYEPEADRPSPGHDGPTRADWIYGHVVVDEAQELSPMQWRMVVRRCPSRSMTIVGDFDQTHLGHHGSDWSEALSAHFPRGWDQRRLTLNYRLPHEVAIVAHRTLEALGHRTPTPSCLRRTGRWPDIRHVARHELAGAAAAATIELAARSTGGTVGVIGPGEIATSIAAALEHLPTVSVLRPEEAKGLEFDAVLVVDPQRVVDAGPSGANDLYVALTRPTQHLVVLLADACAELLQVLSAGRTSWP